MEKLTDEDKKKHFIVCFLAAIICPMFSLGLALGKEYGDKNAIGNHWCWLDLEADGIGIVLGGTLGYFVYDWIAQYIHIFETLARIF